ncbi:ESAT-6 protein secretion system EspG family protein [Herbihabitans rhizosphaerae]|uniref:ESAT-6 protein secretion system EspG family protein n=1 Tax=Herbihabitans rhizosphaerae TaxID=1872711 RepID=A0A4Q7L560_9PSEU|nr:ESX secretion-associated protein EspG [Herbihabitans rhizosphaerae]RZS44356.1 ESAT-6 protein secretion system EspG family protein [Herbihabitans rhizosphaerae]
MTLPADVSLPAELLAAIVHEESLGELHVALAPAAMWRPRARRRELTEQIAAEVARLGWRDRKGRLDAEVEASLRVLCMPTVEYYGWLHDGERTIGVLAAAIGNEAVLALRDGDTVWLNQLRGPSRLASSLVAQTPDVPPGHGGPLRVPQEELAATRTDGRTRMPSGATLRRASHAARTARQLMDQPVYGTGELHTAIRDHLGRRQQAEPPVTYTDTASGRYTSAVTTTSGESFIEIAPATREDLIRRLHTAHEQLTR